MPTPWIDLTAYGMKLLAVDLPGEGGERGPRIMVVAGGDAEPAALATLGFSKHPQSGHWIHMGSPGPFPSPASIAAVLSRATILPDANMSDYHRRLAAPQIAPTLRPDNVRERPANSRFLGINRLGASVYEADGGRFVEDAGGRLVLEGSSQAMGPGLFLHGRDEASLSVAAEGFAREIGEGRVQRYNDLKRFAYAANGVEIDDGDPRLVAAHLAIEAALGRWLARKGGTSVYEQFSAAVKIHESHPYVGDLIRHSGAAVALTPSPVAVIAQRALGTEADYEGKRVVVTGAGAASLFATMPRTADLHVFEADPTRAVHTKSSLINSGRTIAALTDTKADFNGADFVIASLERGLFAAPTEIANGLSVSRSDLGEMVASVLARNANGRSVFILRGGETEAEREEMSATREWIAARFYVEGICDIDGGLTTGLPEAAPMQMFVVGRERKNPIDAAPTDVMESTVVTVFSDLSTWMAKVVANRAIVDDWAASLEDLEAPQGSIDPNIEANTFQAPYVSMSRVGQASTMIPRHLEGASREALGRVVRRHPDLDQWVANELSMSMQQTASVFSPEQIDALALCIDAEERGRPFMNTDQTGLGKGRFLAALMRRAVLSGKKVMFLTQSEPNFSDILRDIRHIGADGEFSTLILNGNAEAVDEANGEVVAKAPPAKSVDAMMKARIWPADYNLIIASYSQFAKEGAVVAARRRRDTNDADVINPVEVDPELYAYGDDDNFELQQAQDVIELAPEAEALADAPAVDPAVDLAAAPQDGDIEVPLTKEEKAAQAAIAADLLLHAKSAWIRHAIDENTVIFLDECHIPASGTSQSSRNIMHAIKSAGHVVFSSATFADKSNHWAFYKSLFPVGLDTANIAKAIRVGGETIQETLSSMLVKDGVMIRREHDLSKTLFTVVTDETNMDRNHEMQDRLAPILAEMAYLSGDLSRRVNNINDRIRDNLRRRFEDDEAVSKRMASLQVNRIGFGSPLYLLSRLFVSSLLVDKAAEIAIQALRDGKKPIIMVDNTIQAILTEIAERQGTGEGAIIPDFKDLMRRVVGQMTKVSKPVRGGGRIAEEITIVDPLAETAERLIERLCNDMPDAIRDADGVAEGQDAGLVDFKDVLNGMLTAISEADIASGLGRLAIHAEALERAVSLVNALPDDPRLAAPRARTLINALPPNPARAVRRILEQIELLPDLPASAIDTIREKINEAGFSCEEITGRSHETRNGVVVRRAKSRKVDVKNRFNSGDTHALIVNKSGLTGVDYHSSRRFLNQDPRVLICLQESADPKTLLQGLGRVVRFDQVVGAEVVTLIAGMPIEMRLLAMRNQKLRRLSANVTSNRDNAVLLTDIPDLMNSVGDTVCSRYATARPDLMRRLALEVDEKIIVGAADDGDVGEDKKDSSRSANTILARLAMLPLAMQIRTLDELQAEYTAYIQELDALGANPLKSRVIDGTVHMREKFVIEGADVENPLSEFHRPVFGQKVVIEYDIRPLRGTEVLREFEKGIIAMGSDGSPSSYADSLERNKDQILAAYLPAEFGSVEAALESNGAYSLKDLNYRILRMIDLLRVIRPGSAVDFAFDGALEQGIVTRVILPDPRRMHLAAHYDIRIVAPGWSRPYSLSLMSLIADRSFTVKEGLNGDDMDGIINTFDEIQARRGVAVRTIMTGNEWGAINLAITHKLGSMVSWKGIDGVNHRGVLVPRDKGVDLLPVPMMNPAMVSAACAEGYIIYGSSDLSAAAVKIERSLQNIDNFIVSLPTRRSKHHGYIYQHPPIAAIVAGLPTADKPNTKNRLAVTADTLDTVVRHLVDGGCKLFLSSRHREWANQWTTEHFAQAQDENEEPAPQMAAA